MIKPETLQSWRASLRSSAARRISQTQAAEMLRVNPRTYERWEREGCPSDAMELAMTAVSLGLLPWSELPRS